MGNDYKTRVLGALNRHHARLARPKKKRPVKNKAPEREVVNQIMAWARLLGWSVAIYEAKATYSPKAGRWLQQSMKAGNADIMGSDEQGMAVFIEAKAPGKLSTLKENQKAFLLSKIEVNSFAVCVDDVKLLESYYTEWMLLRSAGQLAEARHYLTSLLD